MERPVRKRKGRYFSKPDITLLSLIISGIEFHTKVTSHVKLVIVQKLVPWVLFSITNLADVSTPTLHLGVNVSLTLLISHCTERKLREKDQRGNYLTQSYRFPI